MAYEDPREHVETLRVGAFEDGPLEISVHGGESIGDLARREVPDSLSPELRVSRIKGITGGLLEEGAKKLRELGKEGASLLLVRARRGGREVDPETLQAVLWGISTKRGVDHLREVRDGHFVKLDISKVLADEEPPATEWTVYPVLKFEGEQEVLDDGSHRFRITGQSPNASEREDIGTAIRGALEEARTFLKDRGAGTEGPNRVMLKFFRTGSLSQFMSLNPPPSEIHHSLIRVRTSVDYVSEHEKRGSGEYLVYLEPIAIQADEEGSDVPTPRGALEEREPGPRAVGAGGTLKGDPPSEGIPTMGTEGRAEKKAGTVTARIRRLALGGAGTAGFLLSGALLIAEPLLLPISILVAVAPIAVMLQDHGWWSLGAGQ